jgi:hypothetical protein
MILADTSVWIDHLRKGVPGLSARLEEGTIATHPFVIGELACGNLRNRRLILRYLGELPSVTVASDEEVLGLVEDRRIWGKGIGWVDAHLIGSALLTGCALWTRDAGLARTAAQVGLKTCDDA